MTSRKDGVIKMAGASNLHRPFPTENALVLNKELQIPHAENVYFMTM